MNTRLLKIKDFKYWTVYLYPNQYYLGRVFIKANKEIIDLMDISREERDELFQIGLKVRNVLTSLFRPDKFNYCSLGNIVPQLHLHLIPRYNDSRVFENIVFNDDRWGMNYAPYNKEFEIPKEILLKIREVIKENL